MNFEEVIKIKKSMEDRNAFRKDKISFQSLQYYIDVCKRTYIENQCIIASHIGHSQVAIDALLSIEVDEDTKQLCFAEATKVIEDAEKGISYNNQKIAEKLGQPYWLLLSILTGMNDDSKKIVENDRMLERIDYLETLQKEYETTK